jgi:hypothetical protein
VSLPSHLSVESLGPMMRCLRLALSEGPNRAGVSIPSPEDGIIGSSDEVIEVGSF